MSGVNGRRRRWYHGLTRYHWWVLVVGVMAWMFDCMDQQIFVRSRETALKQLMQSGNERYKAEKRPEFLAEVTQEVDADVRAGSVQEEQRAEVVEARVEERLQAGIRKKTNQFGDLVTALMIFGWSVGGFFFGVYGDKWGRVKTLAITISVYSVFTGLSGLATGKFDFCLYRFIMGCGIGGAFATAATLIAETMPEHARATALGLFQALSAVGNIIGAGVARFAIVPENSYLEAIITDGVPGWRFLFFIGTVPAILAVLIMRTIQEPQAWRDAHHSAQENLDKQLGDLGSLFRTKRWRRNTMVGVSLAVIGVIGLWGIGFWSPELITVALSGLPPEQAANVKSEGLIFQNIGAFFGMVAFTVVATRLGRRLAFSLAFLLGWVVVSGVFLFLSEPWWLVYPMFFLLGFATLALFGGYAIYFPELFPARLRSTGTGFCYNVGRVLAAAVMILKIPIQEAMGDTKDSFRWLMAGFALVYLLGFVVLIWAPETKDKPLPTDDDADEE